MRSPMGRSKAARTILTGGRPWQPRRRIAPPRAPGLAAPNCRFEFSVANILQEQTGRDFVSEFCRSGELVDLAGQGIKLHALEIAALGPGDLVGRHPPWGPSADDIVKRYAFVGERDAMRAQSPPAIAIFAGAGSCLPPDELVFDPPFRTADRGRRIAETTIDIDALHAFVIEPAAAADIDDMGPAFEARSVENGDRR